MEEASEHWGLIPRVSTSYEPGRAPSTTLQLAQTLIAYSSTLNAQYKKTWLLEDVESRIRAIRDALKMLSDGSESTATCTQTPARQVSDDVSQAINICFYELSTALEDRYKHTGQIADIEERVELLQRASGTVSNGSMSLTSIQSELGAALRSRFMHAENVQDLSEAFRLHSALLDHHSEPGPDRARLVYELGCTLFIRYGRFGSEDDIPQCISLLNEALQQFSVSHPRRFLAQYFLAMASWMQYRLTGDSSHLHAAIALYRDIIRHQPSNHPDHWLPYNGLSSSLKALHGRTDDIGYLNEAVECARRAFQMQTLTNPNRIRPAINLTLALTERYVLVGHVDDLQESIRTSYLCLSLSHPFRAMIETILALSLKRRYAEFGTPEDLDESIRLHREVLDRSPENHRARPAWSHDLAEALLARYYRDTLLSDLTEAISLFRKSVGPYLSGSSVDSHADCLASALSQYHEDHVDVECLEEAITLCEISRQNQNASRDSRGLLLRRYAKALRLRYDFYHRLEDLNLAISHYEEALDCHPAGHTTRPRSLIELSEVLRYRFEALRDAEDIGRARDLIVNALIVLPEGNPDRSIGLFQLGQLHLVPASPLFSVRAALRNTRQAITDGCQNAQTRLTSGMEFLKRLKRRWPLLAHDLELQRALLDVYSLAVDLLPQVAYFALDVSSRLRVLSNSDQLAVDGAIQALSVNEPKTAIELLEQGRAVFWSQHLRLRTAFDALPVQLATKLSQTAAMLEMGSHADKMAEMEHNNHAKITHENEAAKQRRIGDEFEGLITQARALPGFERFMLPETFQALSAAASPVPTVVFLANDVACQAVIIESGEKVRQVHLPNVSLQELQTLVGAITSAVRNGRHMLQGRALKVETGVKVRTRADAVLEALWRKVVRKIIDALQLKKSQGRSRPRATFCPTGVFARLPLHAAGIYDSRHPEATECLSDYIVPSYTPTIGVLLNAQRHLSSMRTRDAKMILAAISQPYKWARLPFVAHEVALVRTSVPLHVPIDLLGDVACTGLGPLTAPTTGAVLEKLPEATVLHLACHGYQDPKSPLESGFVMQDAMLTVAKLMSLKLDKAFLAFLSACETAKGDKAQPDQAIHLAATMLFAGFKSVVGTMWGMGDIDGPIVAQTIYEELFRTGVDVLDPDSIPYALDDAVRKLRAKGLAASRWAPYVHLGV